MNKDEPISLRTLSALFLDLSSKYPKKYNNGVNSVYTFYFFKVLKFFAPL